MRWNSVNIQSSWNSNVQHISIMNTRHSEAVIHDRERERDPYGLKTESSIADLSHSHAKLTNWIINWIQRRVNQLIVAKMNQLPSPFTIELNDSSACRKIIFANCFAPVVVTRERERKIEKECCYAEHESIDLMNLNEFVWSQFNWIVAPRFCKIAYYECTIGWYSSCVVCIVVSSQYKMIAIWNGKFMQCVLLTGLTDELPWPENYTSYDWLTGTALPYTCVAVCMGVWVCGACVWRWEFWEKVFLNVFFFSVNFLCLPFFSLDITRQFGIFTLHESASMNGAK